MAPSRGVYLWPASPRLRSAVWLAVHYFADPERAYRRYDPEFLYTRKDGYLVAHLGGAFRLGPVELSGAIPFVGLYSADFYERGVVDREVRKVDRAPMRLGVKYGVRIQRGKDIWLLTPYVALSLPTGTRQGYSVSLGGLSVTHASAPPKIIGVMPGIGVAWRRGWWSLTASISTVVALPFHRRDALEPGDSDADVAVDLLGAFQFGFMPFRDMAITLALLHRRTLTDPVAKQVDLLWLAPGIRLQPYLGLYGHLGFMVPVDGRSRARAPAMVTLQLGWEFR